MLKKAGAVAIAAAGLLMLGSPAFASPGYNGHGHGHEGNYAFGEAYFFDEADEEHNQVGLVNFGEDSDVLSNFNICQVEVNVIAVPILSHNDENACITNDNDENTTDAVVNDD